MLDYGCGMGNLCVMAARQGHPVLAVDASPEAIGHLRQRAQAEHLTLHCILAQAQDTIFEGCHDTVLAISLFMFMDCQLVHDQVEKNESANMHRRHDGVQRAG